MDPLTPGSPDRKLEPNQQPPLGGPPLGEPPVEAPKRRKSRKRRLHPDAQSGQAARTLPLLNHRARRRDNGSGDTTLLDGSPMDSSDDLDTGLDLDRRGGSLRPGDPGYLTDEALGAKIHFVTWTPELLDLALKQLHLTASSYDTSALQLPVEHFVGQLLASTSTAFELGSKDGLVGFQAITPTHALMHIALFTPLYRGRTEPLRALLRYAFRTWSFNRVSFQAATSNIAACRFAEKLGFIEEGRQRQAVVLYNGQLDDVVLYGILRDEVL